MKAGFFTPLYWRRWTGSTLFILLTHLCFGQSLPKVIPPSPEVAALVKFLDYPVDYSTGVPDVQIPLYTIKSGSLSYPIGISYHASGRKVYDEAGAIGLGWNLNADGVISRTVYGRLDDDVLYPMNAQAANEVQQSSTTGFDYLDGIAKTYSENNYAHYDSEYDVFSFSFNGHAGKFILKDINGVKTPTLIPEKPYLISFTKSLDNRKFETFTIIDDKGVSYTFGATEFANGDGISAVTAWHIQQIVSSDKASTIDFIYKRFTKTKTTLNQEYFLTTAWNMQKNIYDNTCLSYPSPDAGTREYQNTIDYSVTRLSEISFKGGKIIFSLDPNNLQSDEIKNMQILDVHGNILKSIDFNQSTLDIVSNSNPPTRKLDNLTIKDKSYQSVEKYSFQYYPTANIISIKAKDYWGFYNGSTSFDMVPYYTNIQVSGESGVGGLVTAGSPSSNRIPNLEATKCGMLKSITYPTGGSTEFIYEQNKYLDPFNNQITPGGGLRIHKIKKNDTNGNINYKTFKYGTNENGYGICNLIPRIEYMSRFMATGYIVRGEFNSCGGTYGEQFFTSDFLPEVSYLSELPVVYAEVAEYNGNEDYNIGKSVYKYEVFYPVLPQPLRVANSGQYHITKYNYWEKSDLVEQLDYSNVGGLYSLVRKVLSTYQSTETEQVRCLRVRKSFSFPGPGQIYPVAPNAYPAPGGWQERYAATFMIPPNYVYDFGNYYISVGKKNLTGTTEILYDKSGALQTATQYFYNSKQLQSKKIITDSEGQEQTTETSYPFDYPADATLTQMVGLNMLNYPVENISKLNNNFLKSDKTNYTNWGTAVLRIYPSSVETKRGSGAYERRLGFMYYDNFGNILSMYKDNDVPQSFIYDYQSVYPIASCTGAFSDDIAYTSFEADGKGNWSFSGTPVSDATARTGNKVYNLSNGNLVKNISSSGSEYTVSYWSKSGSANVNNAPARALKNTNGWTLYEHTIPAGPAGVSAITVSGSVVIDEIRLHPSSAQMTTYTYIPLIGAASESNASGIITYYEYDNFGRLNTVRDDSGNILKIICYNYNGQPVNCNTIP